MAKLVPDKIDKWDISVEVEANAYNWNDEPFEISPRRSLSKTAPVHVDLFSGCGGFSTGFGMAGFETNVALDIHPPSLTTLCHNHPETLGICGDIRQVDERRWRSVAPPQDLPTVVTAGVPCQGFSLSNRKRHGDDKRNFLFREFIRIASVVKPQAVILENVSGLASTKDGEFKREIAKAIVELGYDVHFSMLNAADYGVPQFRRRVFFVGVPRGSKWLWPTRSHGPGREPYNTVADAIIGDLPELGINEEVMAYSAPPRTRLQKSLRGSQAVLQNHRSPNHPAETIERIRRTAPGKPMYSEFRQRIRLDPGLPSPTQICGGIRPQFQFGHPTQPRGLSIRERARIQTFPDSYEFGGGIVQGRVQTGNAVPPWMAKVLSVQLWKLLTGAALEGEHGEPLQETLWANEG